MPLSKHVAVVKTTLIIAATSTKVPRPAPTNLRTKILSPTTAWLQWTDQSLGRTQLITDNRYYNIHYQAMPNGKTMSVIVKELEIVLYDLVPATRYDYKVRTVKDGHTSQFSETISNRTLDPGELGGCSNLPPLTSYAFINFKENRLSQILSLAVTCLCHCLFTCVCMYVCVCVCMCVCVCVFVT